MSEEEAIYLLKKTLQIMRDIGQDDANIVIEVRRKEPRHVRFDMEVKPYQKTELSGANNGKH